MTPSEVLFITEKKLSVLTEKSADGRDSYSGYPNCLVVYTEQVRHGNIKIRVVRSRANIFSRARGAGSP